MPPKYPKRFCDSEARAFICAAQLSKRRGIPFFIYKYNGKPLWFVKSSAKLPTGYNYVDKVDMFLYHNTGM